MGFLLRGKCYQGFPQWAFQLFSFVFRAHPCFGCGYLDSSCCVVLISILLRGFCFPGLFVLLLLLVSFPFCVFCIRSPLACCTGGAPFHGPLLHFLKECLLCRFFCSLRSLHPYPSTSPRSRCFDLYPSSKGDIDLCPYQPLRPCPNLSGPVTFCLIPGALPGGADLCWRLGGAPSPPTPAGLVGLLKKYPRDDPSCSSTSLSTFLLPSPLLFLFLSRISLLLPLGVSLVPSPVGRFFRFALSEDPVSPLWPVVWVRLSPVDCSSSSLFVSTGGHSLLRSALLVGRETPWGYPWSPYYLG